MKQKMPARWALLLLSGLLTSCGVGLASRAAPQQYNQSVALDSVTSTCRQHPEQCAALAGKEATAAATFGASAAAVRYIIEADVLARIKGALAECADEARSAVLLEYLGGRSPTQEECAEVLFTEPGGQKVTRAMWLGEKMHEVALPCVEEKLSRFLSGRYSLEPRYRPNPTTGRVEWLSPEEVKAMLRRGGQELKGTIAPDVVIHMGNPVLVLHVFDFKFPCMHTDKFTDWRRYPRGHAYEGRYQYEVYKELLGPRASRVQPRLGVEP